MIRRVEMARRAEKDLTKVPDHVATKLLTWVDDVEARGVEEVRKVPGWHDEPLKGDRKGQRSIRLSKAYRAIYEVKKDDTKKDEVVEFIEIEEVNKHKY